ncbi:MAG TPA: hypothetical protein VD738_04755 [Nitrospira sp.]|jgi:hypothetical protein|nr:hypothetical protein [Nitrospira sp.]
MRNKIPCSAERLGLLDPQMIQAVSEASAFHIGHQYLTENRVRIVEADDSQISSAVIGNSGLYEQTIRLKDGHLISKCSCTLQEEPMCRHCIAVLLEYHRWAQPRQSRRPTATRESRTPAPTDSSSDGNAAATSPSAPDVKLTEIMCLVEWLQPAMHAIEKSERLPDPPKLGSGQVSAWIQTIRNLEDRRRESEEIHVNLESEMRDREAYVGRLTQQLQSSIAEAKAAQATSQELQREVTAYKGILDRVAELAGDITRFDGQIRSVASELLSKGTQLERLTGSFKDVAEALKAAIKQHPSP